MSCDKSQLLYTVMWLFMRCLMLVSFSNYATHFSVVGYFHILFPIAMLTTLLIIATPTPLNLPEHQCSLSCSDVFHYM